jgi:hypothetical protein
MSSEPLKFSSSVAGSAYGKINETTNKAENINSIATSSSTASTTTTAPVKQSVTKPEDISSPHELTAYVGPPTARRAFEAGAVSNLRLMFTIYFLGTG